MELLDLPNDCLREICSSASAAGVSLAQCGESCHRLAQVSHAERCRSYRFSLRSPSGDLYPWGKEKAAYVASEDVAQHVRQLAISKPAADREAQAAADQLLTACSRLQELELTAFRPSDEAWQALAASGLKSLTLHAVTTDQAEHVEAGFADLRDLRVTFALPAGEQTLARCRGPLRLLSFRHFEAPDLTSCFSPCFWDSLVRISLDCGISSNAYRFVDLFESFREHRKSSGRPLPLQEVHIESRRLHITGFSDIIACLQGQPLTELSLMVVSEMPLELLELIAEYLPALEKLSVLYNVDGLLRVSEWPHKPEAYARVLARMPKLQHFGMNHQCFTLEPTQPAVPGLPVPAKTDLVYDLDYLHGLFGTHPALRRIALYGLTLHYRGKLFELDEQGQIKMGNECLFFPL